MLAALTIAEWPALKPISLHNTWTFELTAPSFPLLPLEASRFPRLLVRSCRFD